MDSSTDPPLLFYSTTGSYGCFSNFSRHSIWINNLKWPTSEHYFQGQKFVGTPFEELVRNARDPSEAARLGRDRSKPLRKDWETVKDEVMRLAVYTKFTQRKDLKQILLSTGNTPLVEHTERDHYWGDGGDGSGKNMLGKTLMLVRDQIREEDDKINASKQITSQSKDDKTLKETNSQESSDGSSGSNDEADDIAQISNEQVDGNQLRIVNAPKPKNVKHVSGRRRKARSKRGVFLDSDGSAKLEKNNEQKGSVNVVGTGEPVTFSAQALPPSAKYVIHQNQFVKRHQANEEDFSDEEQDFEPVTSSSRRMNLADFMPSKPMTTTEQTVPDYLMSATSCIAAAQNTVELLRMLPPDSTDFKDSQSQCRLLKEALSTFISQPQEEKLLAQLLEEYDHISKFVPDS